MFFVFVTQKKYDEVTGTIRILSKLTGTLLLEQQCLRTELERTKSESKKNYGAYQEELRRAEHFQARCEAHEDAAHNAGFAFVGTPSGFVLERTVGNQTQETFRERLKAWPR